MFSRYAKCCFGNILIWLIGYYGNRVLGYPRGFTLAKVCEMEIVN